ncbi:MAG: hypothetical protein JNM18_22695 [Planctomycetaceae bacterium]|nr:hypothetical protein [Planctomycetaceae bacterium]
MSRGWSIALLMIAILIGGIYLGWPTRSTASLDPELRSRFENTQKPIVMKLIGSESMLERVKLIGQLQQTIADLSESQRRAIFEYAQKNGPELRNAFLAREQKRIDEFFKLSPDEQTKALDKHIDEMDSMRTMFAGLRGLRNPQPSPPTNIPVRVKSDYRRQLRAQEFLNHTTPEFRANLTNYMQRVEERRKERGLPVRPPPGP